MNDTTRPDDASNASNGGPTDSADNSDNGTSDAQGAAQGDGGQRKRRRGSRGGQNRKRPEGEGGDRGESQGDAPIDDSRNPTELPEPIREGKVQDRGAAEQSFAMVTRTPQLLDVVNAEDSMCDERPRASLINDLRPSFGRGLIRAGHELSVLYPRLSSAACAATGTATSGSD